VIKMYHIKDDKRSIQSADLIVAGFDRLLSNTKYEELTITAIVQEAGVGRTTFYRNFDEKADILLYQMNMNFAKTYENIIPIFEKQVITERVFLELFFSFWLTKKDLLNLIIEANLFNNFQHEFLKFFKTKLTFLPDLIHTDQRGWDYFAEIRCAMLSTALKVAVLSYPVDNAKEIAEMLIKLFGNKQLLIKT